MIKFARVIDAIPGRLRNKPGRGYAQPIFLDIQTHEFIDSRSSTILLYNASKNALDPKEIVSYEWIDGVCFVIAAND